MQYTHILGIDLSKATIDVALSQNTANATTTHKKFSNHIKGFNGLLAWLEQLKVDVHQVLGRVINWTKQEKQPSKLLLKSSERFYHTGLQ